MFIFCDFIQVFVITTNIICLFQFSNEPMKFNYALIFSTSSYEGQSEFCDLTKQIRVMFEKRPMKAKTITEAQNMQQGAAFLITLTYYLLLLAQHFDLIIFKFKIIRFRQRIRAVL